MPHIVVADPIHPDGIERLRAAPGVTLDHPATANGESLVERLKDADGLIVRGTVSGVRRTPVALEKQDFPYTGPFTQVATAQANNRGAFTLTAPPLFTSARLRVVTRTAVPVYSPLTRASVAVKVGLERKRLKRKRYRLRGTIWPAVPNGRVSLQRQSRSGRWGPVARKQPSALSGDRSRYRFTVRRRHRALRYRVVVIARDGAAHFPGQSRTTVIPRR